jgi:hypothetical protein
MMTSGFEVSYAIRPFCPTSADGLHQPASIAVGNRRSGQSFETAPLRTL